MVVDVRDEAVPADVRRLIDSWTEIPAFVRDKHLTVLSANPLARAVSRSFGEGVNLVRRTFIDSDVLRTSPHAEAIAGHVMTAFRESLDRHESDSDFEELVVDASERSATFAALWAEDVVELGGPGTFLFSDTAVGPLRLSYQQLAIPRRFDQTLVVWRAADEHARGALARLAEISTVAPWGEPHVTVAPWGEPHAPKGRTHG